MQEVESKLASKYLTQDQIDAAKEELEHMGENVQDFVNLLTMIDRFVRANDLADAEYEAIYTLVTTLDLMQSSTMTYNPPVTTTFPILSAIAVYDYLLITGVLSSADISVFKNGSLNPFGGGGIPKA